MLATKRAPRTVAPPPASHEQEIPLSAIADSPYQHRVRSGDDLQDVKTMGTPGIGLLHAIMVRPKGDGYELIFGHRRCAAARALGWRTIRGRVCEMDDRRAQEILMIENADREGLSAIEEAREYSDWFTLHPGATQDELAALMKCSQAHVANRLRYLRLPETWQDAIISGEIPHTYARAILPYCDDPRAAAAIAPVRKKLLSKGEAKRIAAGEELQPVNYSDLTRELADAFSKAGTSLHHGEHDKKTGAWIRLPEKLSEAQRAKLDVVSVKAEGHWDEQKIEIAMNRSVWFDLARERHQREEARENRGGKKKVDKPAAEMTAAERKQAAVDEARNKKKRQEQLARRRKEIAADWQRILIARALADPQRTGREVLMVCMLHMTRDWKMDDYRVGCDWDQDIAAAISGAKNGLLESLAADGFNEAKVWDIARAYAIRAFVDPDAEGDGQGEVAPMSTIVHEHYLDGLVAWLKIDLAAAWREEQMGPLSEAWWAAYDREQLGTIGGGLCVDGHMKKGEAVDALVNAGGTVPLPDELRSEKASGKRKPR